MKSINKGFRLFNEVQVIPIYETSAIILNLVCGCIILDEKKMYSDKNIAAIVTSALTAGTGMQERQRLLEMMHSLGITDEMIRRNGGGDLYKED